MTGNVLTMFTVYERPSDFPDHIVVRPCWVARGAIQHSPMACLFDSFLEAQEEMAHTGLYWMPRYPADDPVIMGVWM